MSAATSLCGFPNRKSSDLKEEQQVSSRKKNERKEPHSSHERPQSQNDHQLQKRRKGVSQGFKVPFTEYVMKNKESHAINEEIVKILSVLNDAISEASDIDSCRSELFQFHISGSHKGPQDRPVLAVPGKKRKTPDGF